MKSSDTGNIAELIEMLRQDAVEKYKKDSQINGNLLRLMSGMHMQRSFWSRSREQIRQQHCIIPRQVSGSMNRENRIRLWRGCHFRKCSEDRR